jgi:hypothetical protein
MEWVYGIPTFEKDAISKNIDKTVTYKESRFI